MRILFVQDSLSNIGGGSQLALFFWINALKKNKIKIKLLCGNANLSLPKSLKKSDIIVNKAINLDFLVPKMHLSLYLTKSSKQSIARFCPDIIHLHEPSLLTLSTLKFAKKINSFTVYSYHTDVGKLKILKKPLSFFINKKGIGNRLLKKLQLYILRNCDYITVPTKYYQNLLPAALQKKAFILPYPIRDYFYQKPKRPPKNLNKLITISRLSGEKKIDELIDTIALLKGNFKLTIVGDGIDKKYLEKKVKRIGLEEYIFFEGWVGNKKLPKLLRKHHIFLSMSDFETFGITYIEALASRVPCVVYDYAVSREIIPNNMALFVKSFSPKVWAEKLTLLQRNPLLYTRLINNINKDYNRLLKYNEKKSAKKLIRLYKKIL